MRKKEKIDWLIIQDVEKAMEPFVNCSCWCFFDISWEVITPRSY
jgi:hypothetical protein